MRRAAEAIKKWRQKAIFIDFQKIRITVLDDGEKAFRRRSVPASFLGKPKSSLENLGKVTMRRLSLAELVSGAFAIFFFLVFVYVKMLSFEVASPQATSLLETYAVLSLIIGTTFLITFATSMMCRRVFPGET